MQQLFDEVALLSDVLVAVRLEQVRELVLAPGVPLRRRRMGDQVLAQVDVVGERGAAVDDDVQMVVGRVGRGQQRLATGDAEVAGVLVAQCRQQRDRPVDVGLGNDHVDVDDRLRREAGHSGAPDVLDAMPDRAEGRRDPVADAREPPRPLRVVRDHLCRCVPPAGRVGHARLLLFPPGR